MDNKDKNPFEGVDHSDLTEAEKEARGIETEKEKEERMSKPKPIKTEKSKKTAKPKKTPKPKVEKKPKPPKAPKAPKAKKPAKPKKESDRAPRIVLSEKQLSEPREVVRILPAVMKMVEQFAKKKDCTTNEAADRLITTAWGRIHALARYNEKGS